MEVSQLLAPWEYAGDAPEVLCEGEFSHEGVPVRFELVGPNSERRLIFRLGDDDGSWTTHPAPPSLSPPDLRYATEDVHKALKTGSFRRYFYFDFGAVQLLPEGTGFWSFGVWLVRYPFETHHSILEKRSSQTRDWLLNLLSDANSDASFALRFSRGTEYQQKQIMFGFDSPEKLTRARTQMDRLCRLILRSATSLWTQESNIYWGLHATDGSRPTRFWLRSFTSSKKLVTPYLRRWATLLEQFGPLVIRTNHPCVRDFLRNTPLLASGELHMPTFHEQLEARFELRDWAREHLSADVWAEIEE